MWSGCFRWCCVVGIVMPVAGGVLHPAQVPQGVTYGPARPTSPLTRLAFCPRLPDMSGRTMFGEPRSRIRRGATLTLVFGAVLVTGAVTGSFGAAVGAPARTVRRRRGLTRAPGAGVRRSPPGAAAAPAATPPTSRGLDRRTVGPAAAAGWSSRAATAGPRSTAPRQYAGLPAGAGRRATSASGCGCTVRRTARSPSPGSSRPVRPPRPGVADRRRAASRSTARASTGCRSPRWWPGCAASSRRTRPPRPARPPRPRQCVLLGCARRATRTVTLRRSAARRPGRSPSTTRAAGRHRRSRSAPSPAASAPRCARPRRTATTATASCSTCAATPGGLVDEAVEVASVFLDGGPVASYDVATAARDLYAPARRRHRAPRWWSWWTAAR